MFVERTAAIVDGQSLNGSEVTDGDKPRRGGPDSPNDVVQKPQRGGPKRCTARDAEHKDHGTNARLLGPPLRSLGIISNGYPGLRDVRLTHVAPPWADIGPPRWGCRSPAL
jgi:hypothetical protein